MKLVLLNIYSISLVSRDIECRRDMEERISVEKGKFRGQNILWARGNSSKWTTQIVLAKYTRVTHEFYKSTFVWIVDSISKMA